MWYLSKDGVKIYIHPTVSHSHRMDLNNEAISKITIGDNKFIREQIDIGRIIGKNFLVETHKNDEIVFLERGNRGYKSRMVLGREPTPTSIVTVIIAKCSEEDGAEWDKKYVLITLYEGESGQPEPYGYNEKNTEAIKFWENHALIPTKEEQMSIPIKFDLINNFSFEILDEKVIVAVDFQDMNYAFVFKNSERYECTDFDDYIIEYNECDNVRALSVKEAEKILIKNGYCF